MKAFYAIPLMMAILSLMAFELSTYSEYGKVEGKITTNSGEEMIGVNIQLLDGTVGTTTDLMVNIPFDYLLENINYCLATLVTNP